MPKKNGSNNEIFMLWQGSIGHGASTYILYLRNLAAISMLLYNTSIMLDHRLSKHLSDVVTLDK